MDFLERRFHRLDAFGSLRDSKARLVENPRESRYHSEPRDSKPAAADNKKPPVLLNGSTNVAGAPNRTSYLPREPLLPAGTVSRRQQSLPARRPGRDSDERVRKINSAPDKDKVQGQAGGVSAKAANQQARSRAANPDPGPEMVLRTHGVSTRDHVENYHRSTKFATSWAQVRAENLNLRSGSPWEEALTQRTRESVPLSSRRGPPYCDTSPTLGSRKQSEYTRVLRTQPNRPRMARGRPVHRKQRVGQARSNSAGSPDPASLNSSHVLLRSDGETDSNSEEDVEAKDEDAENENVKANADDGVQKPTKRPPWNDHVNITTDTKPLPKLNSKRYERDLTFKPTLTTKQDVYNAYTDLDGLNIPENQIYWSEDDEAYISPYYDSDNQRSNDSSPNRSKERVLNRREAEMYIKMTGVYGSDAFKNQRKEWFLQKLAKVQEQQAKYEEEQKLRQRKKREEDKRKQQEQLDYVRKKFRREQYHRFRTQYVTSRVLEHEQANRHEYGLPEDFDALGDDQPSEGAKKDPKATADPQEEELNNRNRHKADSKLVTKSGASPTKKPLNDRYQKNSKQKDRPGIERKNKRGLGEQREAEAKQKAREKQREWYKDKDEDEEVNGSPVASNATSGYQSGHADVFADPSDDNGYNNSRDQVNGVSSRNRLPEERFLADKPKQKLLDRDDKTARRNPVDSQTTGKRGQGNDEIKTLSVPKDIYSKELKRHIPSKADPMATNYNRKAQNPKAGREKGKGSSPAYKQAGNKSDSQTISGKSSKDLQESASSEKVNESVKASGKVNESAKAPEKANETENAPEGAYESAKAPSSRGIKKGNAPAVFTGHFRQERDEHYHISEQLPLAYQKKGAMKVNDSSQSNGVKTTDSETAIGVSGDKHSVPPQTKPSAGKKEKQESSPLSRSEHSNESKQPSRASKLHTNEVGEGSKSQPDTSKRGHSGAMSTHGPTAASIASPGLPEISNKNLEIATLDTDQTKQRDFAFSSDHKKDRGESAVENVKTKPESPNKFRPSHPPSGVTVKSKQNLAIKQTSFDSPETVRGVAHRNTSEERSPTTRSSKHSSSPVGKGRSTAAEDRRTRGKETGKHRDGAPRKAALAAIFDVKTGPSWDPHPKIPKMEGIDTVVIEGKDGKGRVVKRKKNVKDVVREADKFLKVPEINEPLVKGRHSRGRSSGVVSPALTLGSDFNIDDDEDETEDEIFERLRKKYNIKIDSDEEDDDVGHR